VPKWETVPSKGGGLGQARPTHGNGISRRGFLNTIAGAAGGAVGLAGVAALGRDEAVKRQPNVILVMTDDQGCGDLRCHGNERIRTPNLDPFQAQPKWEMSDKEMPKSGDIIRLS